VGCGTRGGTVPGMNGVLERRTPLPGMAARMPGTVSAGGRAWRRRQTRAGLSLRREGFLGNFGDSGYFRRRSGRATDFNVTYPTHPEGPVPFRSGHVLTGRIGWPEGVSGNRRSRSGGVRRGSRGARKSRKTALPVGAGRKSGCGGNVTSCARGRGTVREGRMGGYVRVIKGREMDVFGT
jgi:hypothetical protein